MVAARLIAWPVGKRIDRDGPRPSLLTASAGLLGSGLLFSLQPNALSATLQILCMCIGSSVLNIAFRVLTARSVRAEDHSSAFALMSSASNAGIVLGPVASLWLLKIDNQSGIGLTSACFALLGAAFLVRLSTVQACRNQARHNETEAPRFTLSCLQHGAIYANLILSWSYIQALVIALASISDHQFGSVDAATVFFAAQALTVVPLLPVAGRLLKRTDLGAQIFFFHLGCALIPAAIFPFALATREYAALAAIALALVITVGEALSMPTLDTIVAGSSARDRQGRAFGHMATAQAVGMALGTGLSSLLTVEPPILSMSAMLLLSASVGFSASILLMIAGRARPWRANA